MSQKFGARLGALALALGLTLTESPLAFGEEKVENKGHAPIPFPTMVEGPVSILPQEPALGGEFTFQWPMEHVQINSPFGMRRDPVRKSRKKRKVKLHAGIDLDGEIGDTVLAAGPGRVLHAGWYSGYGNYILIQHANGYLSHYGHLSEVLVYRGQMVRQGAPIGLVGSTGHSTGPHLHFGITHEGKWQNPVKLIKQPSNEEIVAKKDPDVKASSTKSSE